MNSYSIVTALFLLCTETMGSSWDPPIKYLLKSYKKSRTLVWTLKTKDTLPIMLELTYTSKQMIHTISCNVLN
ncbi:hypothetical protein ACHAXS_000753 [Conticribra weissflogii]